MGIGGWLIVVGVTAWLALMGLAATLPIAPAFFLRLTERLICPPGTKMEVRTFRATYHRPGERGLEVACVGPGVNKDVKVKAILALWALYLVPALPLAVLVVRWVAGWTE
jgi:hypothetical protein